MYILLLCLCDCQSAVFVCLFICCPFASPALDGWDSVIECKQRYSQTRSDAICTTSHAVCSAIPPPPTSELLLFPVTRLCPMTVPLMRHDSQHGLLRCRARNSVVLYYALPVFFFYGAFTSAETLRLMGLGGGGGGNQRKCGTANCTVMSVLVLSRGTRLYCAHK